MRFIRMSASFAFRVWRICSLMFCFSAEVDVEQPAVLLELEEGELGVLELLAQLDLLLAEPGVRGAGSLQLVVQVGLDVGLGERVRQDRRPFRLAIPHDDLRDARVLDRLDRHLAGERARQAQRVAPRASAGERGVVRVVGEAELVGDPLRDGARLNDSELRLVELLGREEGPGAELDGVLDLQDLGRVGLDDDLAGRLVDLGLPVGVDERAGHAEDRRQRHERPALADDPPVGAQVYLVFERLGAARRLRPRSVKR